MNHKIMIADDDDGILDALQIMLEMEGYQVFTTVNGATVPAVNKEHPDLLLLDIWMAGMDGKEICRQLKSQDQTKRLPVIMVSASKDVEQDAVESGADGFIAKPFDREELLTTIDKYLKTVKQANCLPDKD